MIWEQRWHPLREEWVIIAAHRQNRPWSGERVESEGEVLAEYVADCYLCPGNRRVSGISNPQYGQTFVFDNDHPCVGFEAPSELEPPVGLYRKRSARGIARVVCYTPKHNLTLAELDVSEVETLLRVWREQYIELGNHPEINSVLIFENKGEVVGVSNPHPHSQIYATNFVAKFIESEARASQRYLAETGRLLFQDILAAEQQDGRRIICENQSAIAMIPYFARYAYEVFIAPKATHPSLATLSEQELRDLAQILKKTLVKLDNLWQMSFPYVMAVHQAPTDGHDHPAYHFHIEFHPPLRKPNLMKYLAGAELGGGNYINNGAPEEKAAEVRAQSEVHYKHQSAQEE
ncbi:MAG: galactose-1-phosphate uridylyltransferase [Ardenticatenaceae bacterium]